MTKQAWFCPACQRHHAPHVETCPGTAASPYAPVQRPSPYMPYPKPGSSGDVPQRLLGGLKYVHTDPFGGVSWNKNGQTGELHLGWFTPGLFGTPKGEA